jgi:hypothetical protein
MTARRRSVAMQEVVLRIGKDQIANPSAPGRFRRVWMTVRPSAKPIKPGMPAAVVSLSRSSSPRPRMMQPTLSRFAAPRDSHNFLAVFAAVETLDLPGVRLNSRVLELPHCLDHKPQPELQVVRLLVPLEGVELRLLRRHQQLEHERAAAPCVQVFGQAFQAARLSPIEDRVTLRIVARQHFAECRVECLNMFGEVFAILEFELTF